MLPAAIQGDFRVNLWKYIVQCSSYCKSKMSVTLKLKPCSQSTRRMGCRVIVESFLCPADHNNFYILKSSSDKERNSELTHICNQMTRVYVSLPAPTTTLCKYKPPVPYIYSGAIATVPVYPRAAGVTACLGPFNRQQRAVLQKKLAE